MLEKLIIENFQKHKNVTLDLTHPVVSLVGPSDIGKSSFVRALRWLLLNKPKAGRLRHGAKYQRVTAWIDGKVLVRYKGRKGNFYVLDGKKHAAVGAAVPEEIAQLLRVTEYNIQRQHATPFWFGLSSGRVSQELNQIVNLEIIDRSLDRAVRGVRKAHTLKTNTAGRLSDAEKTRDELAWTETAAVMLGKADQWANLADTKRLALRTIGYILTQAQKLDQRHENATRATGGVGLAYTVALHATNLQKRIASLRTLRDQLQHQVIITAPSVDLSILQDLVETAETARQKIESIKSILKAFRAKDREQCENDSALAVERKTLAQVIKDQCPVCGKAT